MGSFKRKFPSGNLQKFQIALLQKFQFEKRKITISFILKLLFQIATIITMSAYIFANSPLVSPPQQICLTNPRYCAPHETKFKICEEFMSFSNDDFKIIDSVTGQLAFLVSGKVVSLREEKIFYDASNSPICNMKHNFFNLLGKKYKFYSQGQLLFTIKNHHRWFANQGTKLSILSTFGTITLEAAKMDSFAVVTLQTHGQLVPIAKIQKPLHTARNIAGNVQDYEITIAPNVDIVAMIALVIALDELGEKNGDYRPVVQQQQYVSNPYPRYYQANDLNIRQ